MKEPVVGQFAQSLHQDALVLAGLLPTQQELGCCCCCCCCVALLMTADDAGSIFGFFGRALSKVCTEQSNAKRQCSMRRRCQTRRWFVSRTASLVQNKAKQRAERRKKRFRKLPQPKHGFSSTCRNARCRERVVEVKVLFVSKNGTVLMLLSLLLLLSMGKLMSASMLHDGVSAFKCRNCCVSAFEKH